MTMKPAAVALIGAALALPFAAANIVVANRVEPFFSIIRPGEHTSTFEYVLLAVALGCIALGAVVAALPVLRKGSDGRRTFLPLNSMIAVVMLALFVTLAGALGPEIYRCDVLHIPNCD